MRTKTIFKDICVLIILFAASCSTQTTNKPTPAPQLDSIGTAQAQTSDLEYSSPPQEILPKFEFWIDNNSYEIQSIDSTDFSDLQFLEPLLEGKRIVQLGEDDHKTSEQSLMKARIIKYLHQELGYEVIAFESGLLSCYVANCKIHELKPIETMDHIFYDIWHTEEVLPLIEYIIETSSSSSPLILAGFDIISFGEGQDDGFGFYYSFVEDLDSNYASEIRVLEELFLFPAGAEEILKNVNDIVGYQKAIQLYDDLADDINQNQQILQQYYSSCLGYINVAEQSAWSRARYIEAFHYTITNTEGEHITVRDKSMAVNVKFLADELYPDKKIIIWAHNGHVAKKSPWPGSGIDNMGTYLTEYFGDDIFTIGLIGHRSTDSYWSLENQLHLYEKPYLFADLSSVGINEDSADIPIQIKTVIEFYDAMIFLDKLTSHNPIDRNE